VLGLALGLAPSAAEGGGEDPQTSLEESAARDPEGVASFARGLLGEDLTRPDALRSLLHAAAALGRTDLLDDAIEVGRPLAEKAGDAEKAALGSALLARARLEDPPDRARLAESARLLAPAEKAGTARATLDLAYARHYLGERDGARAAYERVLDGPEPLAERALAGLSSLAGGKPESLDPETESLLSRHPEQPALARARANAVARAAGPAEAAAFLSAWASRPERASGRLLSDLGGHLRSAGREREAEDAERRAAEHAADPVVAAAVWGTFRRRPLATFDDCDRLERDARLLLGRARDDPFVQAGVRNDVAFLLREVVSGFTWRGEARTQGLAEGAPPQARVLLDRCVALYEESVARIPKDVADRPFAQRWLYAGMCNDAGLMRHYFVDVRDLAKAEALYLRAFELTDGAYMDAYYYNLQYLYGFELPGREETWFRLARRASERILRETADGQLEPDERKREAARRDAEALKALLAARDPGR
jgi:hypothetical protein